MGNAAKTGNGRGRAGGRLKTALGMLISREIMVLTNAIAFNFLLCLFPLLLVVAAVSQQLPFSRRTSTALLLVLQELIPFDHASLAESLRGLSRTARTLEAFSLVLIVWGSSGIFMPMEMALNKAWGGAVPRDFWKSRLLAFFMTVAGGGLALGSVLLTVTVRTFGRELPTLAGYAAKASALLLTLMLFFLIYRLIPQAPVGGRVALKAALWAGGAWEAIKYFFVIRIDQMNLAAFYGPLALSVSLILWAQISSLVLVFGALMTPVDHPRGRR
jgi:membrane protein/epoxyqueuosine reductase